MKMATGMVTACHGSCTFSYDVERWRFSCRRIALVRGTGTVSISHLLAHVSKAANRCLMRERAEVFMVPQALEAAPPDRPSVLVLGNEK